MVEHLKTSVKHQGRIAPIQVAMMLMMLIRMIRVRFVRHAAVLTPHMTSQTELGEMAASTTELCSSGLHLGYQSFLSIFIVPL